jgi:methionine biosynthesis protein MetW
MLRVGREAIVTFPNFGHWTHRLQILRGRMPVSTSLPYQWYDTPNIHLCTVADFDAFLAERRYKVLDRVILSRGRPVGFAPNLTGELAIYRFRR